MKKKLRDLLKWDYTDIKDDILYKSEVQANKVVAIAMIICGLVFLLALLLVAVGVFPIEINRLLSACIEAFLELTIPAIICFVFQGRKKWLKYLLLIEFVIVAVRLDNLLTYNVVLLMIIPIILSSRYYSKNLSIIISVLTFVLFFLSSLTWGKNQIMYEYNVYTWKEIYELIEANGGEFALSDDYTLRVLRISWLPRSLFLIAISFISIASASRGKKMVEEQANIAKKNSRMESELNLATSIQANMLPTIFPPYPDQNEFDLFASMNPAKEVGGDFYDFFMLDEKTIAIVIADVSGKGVPAALFMVIAKTLIKNQAQSGLTPGEVFTKVNQMLCENNEMGLFVTAWMGYLNTETGVLTYANAGHNPPLIKHGDNDFEYLKSKHGFVLAGMEALKYKNYTYDLAPGDKVFLYTDGVTEGVNEKNEQFGEDRLVQTINQFMFNKTNGEDTPQAFIEYLKGELIKFAGNAEQFDDITMLAFSYIRRYENKTIEREFPAVDESLDKINEFLAEELEKRDCTPKALNQINIATEEIFVNIAHYAYQNTVGKMKLTMEFEEDMVKLRFIDYGMPFNPLAKNDPDITLSAEDRDIGGLGIFMVKKIMDNVEYKYENGKNILILTKKITKEVK